MIGMNIHITPDDAGSGDVKKFSKSLATEIKMATRELAENVAFKAQELAPKKTGRLARNILISKKTANKFTVYARTPQGARAPYQVFQEYGVPASSFVGWRPIRKRGMVAVAKPPYHKGIKPVRYMRRAADVGRSIAPRIFGDRIRVSMNRSFK